MPVDISPLVVMLGTIDQVKSKTVLYSVKNETWVFSAMQMAPQALRSDRLSLASLLGKSFLACCFFFNKLLRLSLFPFLTMSS